MDRFVIRTVDSGVKFDLKAANGQTVLTSEVYETMAACRRGMASVRKNAPVVSLEDQTAEDWKPLPNSKFELYQDRNGGYRFRLKARNGKIIGISESYSNKSGCLAGIESVRQNAVEI